MLRLFFVSKFKFAVCAFHIQRLFSFWNIQMSEVGFFGLVVAPGKKEKVTPPEGRVLRLSSAALDVREKVWEKCCKCF